MKILLTGGHWVNLGPLLYHFADLPGENSIEPSYEVVKQIITSIGFKILVSLCSSLFDIYIIIKL